MTNRTAAHVAVPLAVLVAGQALLAETVQSWADFSTDEVAVANMAVSTNSAVYNSYYGSTWVLSVRGASRITARFSIYGPPTSATLTLRHLTSASAGARGGGYSPVSIAVNGATFLGSYDVAGNHDGSHGLETDVWDVTGYIRQGENSVSITLGRDAETNYWIQRLEVLAEATGAPSAPDRSSCSIGSVAGFVVCGAPAGDGSEEFLRGTLEFVAEEATDELISQGAGYLVGLVSKGGALLAGHLTSFLLSFIQAIPTANPPTRIRYVFLTGSGAYSSAYVPSGTPVHAVALVQPGTEIVDVQFDLRRPDGTSCYARSVPYDDVSHLWHLDRVLVLISEQPIVLNTRGVYRMGNATLNIQ